MEEDKKVFNGASMQNTTTYEYQSEKDMWIGSHTIAHSVLTEDGEWEEEYNYTMEVEAKTLDETMVKLAQLHSDMISYIEGDYTRIPEYAEDRGIEILED